MVTQLSFYLQFRRHQLAVGHVVHGPHGAVGGPTRFISPRVVVHQDQVRVPDGPRQTRKAAVVVSGDLLLGNQGHVLDVSLGRNTENDYVEVEIDVVGADHLAPGIGDLLHGVVVDFRNHVGSPVCPTQKVSEFKIGLHRASSAAPKAKRHAAFQFLAERFQRSFDRIQGFGIQHEIKGPGGGAVAAIGIESTDCQNIACSIGLQTDSADHKYIFKAQVHFLRIGSIGLESIQHVVPVGTAHLPPFPFPNIGVFVPHQVKVARVGEGFAGNREKSIAPLHAKIRSPLFLEVPVVHHHLHLGFLVHYLLCGFRIHGKSVGVLAPNYIDAGFRHCAGGNFIQGDDRARLSGAVNFQE